MAHKMAAFLVGSVREPHMGIAPSASGETRSDTSCLRLGDLQHCLASCMSGLVEFVGVPGFG